METWVLIVFLSTSVGFGVPAPTEDMCYTYKGAISKDAIAVCVSERLARDMGQKLSNMYPAEDDE